MNTKVVELEITSLQLHFIQDKINQHVAWSEEAANNKNSIYYPCRHLITSLTLPSLACMYVSPSVAAQSHKDYALLRWRVFNSIHIAQMAFGTQGIADIRTKATVYRTGEAD